MQSLAGRQLRHRVFVAYTKSPHRTLWLLTQFALANLEEEDYKQNSMEVQVKAADMAARPRLEQELEAFVTVQTYLCVHHALGDQSEIRESLDVCCCVDSDGCEEVDDRGSGGCSVTSQLPT